MAGATPSDRAAAPRTTPLTPTDPRELGSYTIQGRLGEGGMGTVYLGTTAAGRRVAIKVIRADFAREDHFRARFRREAESARRVARFCTAEVVDADPEAEQPYLVTEYIDGPTLAEVVSSGGPMSTADLERLAVSVAAALTAIHGAGVVHRDLKPSNVLLSRLGPRVIDFGIARAMDATTNLSQDLRQIGTPAFMAPEQVQGGEITTKADIFAWGGIVTYAGTGQYPFGDAPTHVLLYRAVYEPPRLDGLEERLRAVVERAMSKEPTDRPSAQDLLMQMLGGAPALGEDPRAAVTQVLSGWAPMSSGPGVSPTAPGAQSSQPGGRTFPPGVLTPPPVAGSELPTAAATPVPTPTSTPTGAPVASTPPPAGAATVAAPSPLTPPPNLRSSAAATRATTGVEEPPPPPGLGPPSPPTKPGRPGRSARRLWPRFAVAAAVLAVVATLVVVKLATGGGSGGGSSGTSSGGSGSAATKPTLAWKFNTGRFISSSPLVAGGKVIFGSSDNKIHAVDVSTHKQRWAVTTGGNVGSSPAYSRGYVFVGSSDHYLYKLRLDTGRQLWRYQAGDAVGSSPTLDDNTVYFGADDGVIYALNASDGSERWRFQTGGKVMSSPTVHEGVLYVGSLDGNLYAVDAATGTEKWHRPLGGGVYSSPFVTDDAVYIGTNVDSKTAGGTTSGAVYRFDHAGQQAWRFPTPGLVSSSPVVANGVVYFGCFDGTLYGLDAQTSGERGRFRVGSEIFSSPAVVGTTLYVGSHVNTIFAIDISARPYAERWKYPADAIVGTSPSIVNGVLYIGSDDGFLYALKVPEPAARTANVAAGIRG
jgi:outer membrane protein assembly factor BamB/serine/threonine protein kinase